MNSNHYLNRMDRQNRSSAVLYIPNPTPIYNNYMTGTAETNQPAEEKKSDQTTKKNVEYKISPLCFGITLGAFCLFFGISLTVLVLVWIPTDTVKPKLEGNCSRWVVKETPTYHMIKKVQVGKNYLLGIIAGQVPFSKAFFVCGVNGIVFPIKEVSVETLSVDKAIKENQIDILQGESKPFLVWTSVKWTLQQFKTELIDTIYNENIKLKSYPSVSFCDDYIERIRFQNIIKKKRFNTTNSQNFDAFMQSETSSVYLVKDFSSASDRCYQFYTEEELNKKIGSKTGETSASLSFVCYSPGDDVFTPGKLNELEGVYRGEAYKDVGKLKEQKYSDLNQNEFKDIKLFFYAAPLTFDEAKLQCESKKSTLLILDTPSMDRYIDYKIKDKSPSPGIQWQTKLNNPDLNAEEEFMWTGGFFDLLSDKPLQLHWNDVKMDITPDVYTNFCNGKKGISAQIEQQLELLKMYKNADGTPCNNTRRYVHIVRPFRVNIKSEFCWTLYVEDVFYPGASNMGFICYFKQQQN